MKNYEKIENSDTELKIQVYYNKGGLNYFNYKNEERGYYLSVCPVQVERKDNGICIESYTAFSGVKKLVLPVKRQSDKKYNEAVQLAESHINELKEYVLSKI